MMWGGKGGRLTLLEKMGARPGGNRMEIEIKNPFGGFSLGHGID